MADGYKLDKGFLVDRKWEKQLRRLEPTQFHRLFWDLYDFQTYGNTPPEYNDPLMDTTGEFITEHIQHRLNGAMRGGTPPTTPEGTPPTTIPRGGEGTPPKTKTKTNADTNAIFITPPTPSEGESGEGFDEFWDAYPRKEGKQNARKAWDKLCPDEELLYRILDAVALQKESSQWMRDNGRYIPLPTSWLNGKRWEDELMPVNSTSGNPFSDYLAEMRGEKEGDTILLREDEP